MMTDKSNDNRLSDETLARYISGKSSADEEADVLDYMAESDENVDELLAVAEAVDQQRKAEKEALKKRKTIMLRPVLYVAASLVILFLVNVIWRIVFSGNPDGSAVVVAISDSSATNKSHDAVLENSIVQSAQDIDNGVVAVNNPAQPKSKPSQVRNNGDTSGVGVYHTIQRVESHMASRTTKDDGGDIKMIFPRRSLQTCVSDETFTFRWEDIIGKTTLTVSNSEGLLLIKADVSDRNNYTLDNSIWENNDKLLWTLTHEDMLGNIQSRQGTIKTLNR